MLLLLCVGLQVLAGDSLVFNGRAGELDVRVPRFEERVTVDGWLNESTWNKAAVLTGFSQYRPADGRIAEDSTRVLIWYGPSAIHFGIRAFAEVGSVNATLADRDKIESDDYVQILIDTFDDRRQALVFGLNPLGVQSDGIWSEGRQLERGQQTGPDLTRDFVFDSRGRVTEYGYEVEVRIPFVSISYQAGETQDWGVNVLRKVQRSGHVDSWAPAIQADVSFLGQSGRLVGMYGIHRGLVFDITPVVTGSVSGLPRENGDGWDYQSPDTEFGLDAHTALRPNLNLDGTLNPDFSQVEADVGRIMSNQRFALYFPEKRPFFLEGTEHFETPNRLIYTRRVVNPVGGAKLAGKVGSWGIGFLSAVDEKSLSVSGNEYPVFNMLRVRRDLGENSWAGLAYTDRIEGSDYNRVAVADARFVFGRVYFVQLQSGASVTRSGGQTTVAPLWEAVFNRTGHRHGFNYRLTGIHPDFSAQSGFVPRVGELQASLSNSLTWYGDRGAAIEQYSGSLRFAGWWEYAEPWDFGTPTETKVFFGHAFTFRGGWTMRLTPAWETTAWDPNLYLHYAIETPNGSAVDTVPFTTPGRVNDAYGILARFATPEFDWFSANLAVNVFPHDVGFIETSKVNLLRITAEASFRPTSQLRINARYARLVLDRDRDGSNLSTSQIPRLRIEYQLFRSTFVRLVGQYEWGRQDALRDPRTDYPILVWDDDVGEFVRAASMTTNNLRVDALISYRPTPGTVFFLGYGSSLNNSTSRALRDLRRDNDALFVKLSYRFRR